MEMFIKLTNQQLFGDFGSQTTQQMALGVNHECGERGGLRKNKKIDLEIIIIFGF